jgi:subtilisin family serine protease
MVGIVGAATDNGVGMAGIGYSGVKIMPVTVLGADGTGTDSNIVSGVTYAADHGANVILMAFSNPGYSQDLQDAINYAWSKGAVVVAAAGNDGSTTVNYPAGDQGVVGVANTDQNDQLNLSSNDGQDVFMAAPGTDIYTTAPGDSYTTITGTSASAAEVAGAAALMEANDPSVTNGVIVNRLAADADPLANGETAGNGRLNLYRAINDTSTSSIEPAGAPPVGDGGPLVGPYVITATSITLSPTVGRSASPASLVTVSGGKFNSGLTNGVTIKWDGSGGSTVTTCSTDNGGNIT